MLAEVLSALWTAGLDARDALNKYSLASQIKKQIYGTYGITEPRKQTECAYSVTTLSGMSFFSSRESGLDSQLRCYTGSRWGGRQYLCNTVE